MRVSIRQGNGWFLVAMLAAACGHISLGANPPTMVLSVADSNTTVAAGAAAQFWLNALNPAAEPTVGRFPATLECRVESASGTQQLTAVLRDSSLPVKMEIAPGAFARREYVLQLPTALVGEVMVETVELGQGRLVFHVQPALAEAPPAQKGVVPFLQGRQPGAPASYSPEQFFKDHIFGYEPLYFIAGTKSPNAKFQISFKYRLVNTYGGLAQRAPWVDGFFLAYSQTSLWDWNAPSAPFFDSSYRPEFFYAWPSLVGGGSNDWFRLDLQGGAQHESNGRAGAASRSLNIVYLRPTLVFGRENEFQLQLSPRVWTYVGGLSDNPDLADYRGYVDLRAALGWAHGLQASMLGRIGKTGRHPTGDFALSYPLMHPPHGSLSVYLMVQYFTGYGESLLAYNQRSSILRAGFALYR